jgi:hypothetical protein
MEGTSLLIFKFRKNRKAQEINKINPISFHRVQRLTLLPLAEISFWYF